MSGVQQITVEAGEAGARLDRWFKRRFPHVGQGMIAKLCRKGQIRLDGSRVKPDARVEAGMVVRVPPMPEPGEAVREKPKLSDEDAAFARSLVLYEDEELIAFNKPSGLAVQGGTKTQRHLDGLLSAFGEGDKRPRLVHRLDKDTSGVIVAGKSPAAAARLAKAFQGHRVQKTYWAVTIGMPKPKFGEIKGFMRKAGGLGGDPDREMMVAASHGDEGAKHALTRYAVAADAGQRVAWVALRPETGRTHQLRVHMAAMGTAILGDRKYTCHRAAPENFQDIKLCLHARRLVLPRGAKGELVLEAPPPKHMLRAFGSFGFAVADYDSDLMEEQLS